MTTTETFRKIRGEIGQPAMNYYAIIKSPVDDLLLVADDSALTGVYFGTPKYISAAMKGWTLDPRNPLLQQAEKELEEYFAEKRKVFSLPLRFTATDFQTRVWQEIAIIPFAETISYSELAKRAGAPEAIRAAGTATGRNPISIIVPCHRVMGKNGGMCGFGGGLERKRFLLNLENSSAVQGRQLSRQHGSRRQLSLI
jgi:methylated-DNA-[protein]-cysteine S-methyltransferase